MDEASVLFKYELRAFGVLDFASHQGMIEVARATVKPSRQPWPP